MRKLAWFAAGFGAACLWACYFAAGTAALLVSAVIVATTQKGAPVKGTKKSKPVMTKKGW